MSRLACSYVDQGCGFNFARAGDSIHGINDRPIIPSADESPYIPWATLQANASMDDVEDDMKRIEDATEVQMERLAGQLKEECAALDEVNSVLEERVELAKAVADLKKREEASAERWRAF